MKSIANALYRFFSGFDLPAYGKNNVPDGASMPYITYELVNPAPLSAAMFHAWVWYRGDTYVLVSAKCDEIESALRDGGASIPTDTGSVYIMMDDGTPFAQEQPDPDKNVRVMYLTMILHADTY